ncbi:MAG TPA: hypothetical protein VF143_08265 [Candidatus Nanopelagicales bacterium]
MSRVFWMAVGAVGGVAAYRKGTRAVRQAKALGPLGSAQVAAAATSRVAARTANGLGRLADIKAQREGRLVIGTAQDVSALPQAGSDTARVIPIDDDWVPVPERRPGPPPRTAPAAAAAPAHHGGAPATSVRTAPRTTRARRG